MTATGNRQCLSAGGFLDRDDHNPGWARPNEKMPVEDIQLLGTDTPATPTYRAPRGDSLDAYLSSAAQHLGEAERVWQGGFNATAEIQRALARFAGGRPVELPRAADGRPYLPYTLRRFVDGKQIGIHHDYHDPLSLLASGRCLHRVDKIAGPRARVTTGGFLALDKDRRRVFFWS